MLTKLIGICFGAAQTEVKHGTTSIQQYNTITNVWARQVLSFLRKIFMNFLKPQGTKLEIIERFNDLIFSLKPFCGILNIDSAFRWKVMSDYNSHCTGNQDSALWSIKEGTSGGRLDRYSVPGKNAADISQLERFYSLSGLLAKTYLREHHSSAFTSYRTSTPN